MTNPIESQVPQIGEPVAYGIYLVRDGRFMDIASSVEQDAIDMAEYHYETDEYTVQPLFSSRQAAALGATLEALRRIEDYAAAFPDLGTILGIASEAIAKAESQS